MAPMDLKCAAALLAVMLSGVIASAQQAGEAPANKQGTCEGKSLIEGLVVDPHLKPAPGTSVRLRDLHKNAVENSAKTNQAGRFSFAATPNIPYVVELLDKDLQVVGVSHVVVVQACEVAEADVAIPYVVGSGIFGNTSSAIISAAAGMGLTVVGPALPKLSPRE